MGVYKNGRLKKHIYFETLTPQVGFRRYKIQNWGLKKLNSEIKVNKWYKK